MAVAGEVPEPEPHDVRPSTGPGGGGLPVLLAVPEPGAEAELVASLGRPGAVVVVRRCVDLPDLLAAASTGTAVAAVVSSALRRFDQDAVARLRRAGVAVVGLVVPPQEAGAAAAGAGSAADAAEVRLRQLGIEQVVVASPAADSGNPDGLAAEVAQAVRTAVATDTATGAGPGLDGPTALDGDPDRGTVDLRSPATPPGPRRVLAVWGPTGAPGRSLLAWHLAGEHAAAGRSTLLVDADVYGGTIAQLAGLVDEAPGVVAACRAANAGALDVPRLAGLARSIPLPSREAAPLSVLTGIGHASRWPEVRPAALETVLASARALAERVIVDCGFNLEDDEELSYDTSAPRRNAATLAALSAADEVLVVGSAEPVGLTRLIAGLDDLRSALEAAGAAPTVRVVVNRLHASGRQRREVAAALERHAAVVPAGMLPFDPAATDRAQREGRLLLEIEPRSPLRLAIAGLVEAPAHEDIARPRRRGRRATARAG